MMSGTGVNGLWKSITCAELSLVATAAGTLVGVYRVPEPSGSKEYPLSGHAVGDSVAFSVPFLDHGSLVAWSGSLAVDAEGPRLDFVRRVVGQAVTDVQREALDTFRLVRSAAVLPNGPADSVAPLPRAAGAGDAPL